MKEFLLNRIENWDKLIEKRDIAATLFRDNLALRYFLDFSIVSGFYLVLFHTSGEQPNDENEENLSSSRGVLIVPRLEFERAADHCKDLPIDIILAEERHNLAKSFTDIGARHDINFKNIGVCFDSVTLSDYGSMYSHIIEPNSENLASSKVSQQSKHYDPMKVYFPDSTHLKDVTELFNEIRKCKDAEEISRLKKAAQITDHAMKVGIESLEAGKKEIEIAALIEYEMKKLGAEDKSFDTIVASGPNSWYPHAGATERIMKNGELVTIDMGATYQGYHADLTRTVIIGDEKPNSKFACIINTVNESQEAALDVIGPGVICENVDAAARNYLKGKNLEQYFIHGLGHGVGLDVHDPIPRLAKNVNYKLEPGMVVTVEPGIYIPQVGGARTEDLVLITKNGYEKLSHAEVKWY